MKYHALALIALLSAGLSGCGHMDYVPAGYSGDALAAPAPVASASAQPYTAYVNGQWVTVYPKGTAPASAQPAPPVQYGSPSVVIVTVPGFCPSPWTQSLFGTYTPGCPVYVPYGGGGVVIRGRITIGGGHHR